MTKRDTGVVVRAADWKCDRHALLRVRFAVFVDEQGVPPELERDDNDDDAYHVVATAGEDKALGTARLLANGHIGRMAVLATARGRGIGSALLRHLLDTARDQGLTQVFLHAQLRAVAFYERHGFVAHGPVFDDAGIDHRAMALDLEEPHPRNPPGHG